MKQMCVFSFLPFCLFLSDTPAADKNQTFCQSATAVHLFSVSLTVGNFHCTINRIEKKRNDI